MLEHSAADGFADPQVRDAPVGIDLVVVLEESSAWALRVLELQLLLQAEQLLLHILVMAVELAPEDGLEPIVDPLLLCA